MFTNFIVAGLQSSLKPKISRNLTKRSDIKSFKIKFTGVLKKFDAQTDMKVVAVEMNRIGRAT